MSARTPAELKELFESDTFARDTTCTGPLGPEYTLPSPARGCVCGRLQLRACV